MHENIRTRLDAPTAIATVESMNADVQRLEQLQSYEKVYAPFSGVITARNTDNDDQQIHQDDRKTQTANQPYIGSSHRTILAAKGNEAAAGK
jgi:hypothetical protein